MKIRKQLALPLAGLALLVGGAVAVQAASPSPSASSSAIKPGQTFLDKLAAILHISPDQLKTDVKDARLQTIDQLLKDGKITQAQADKMKQEIESGKDFDGFGFHERRDFMESGVAKDVSKAVMDAVSKELKKTPEQIKQALRSGQSIADLEKAAGVSDTDLRNAAKAAAKTVLDKAVKDGKITQAEEDDILGHFDSAKGPFFFGGHFGRHHMESKPGATS